MKKPREAFELTVAACDNCCGIHINLLDAKGVVFATGTLPCAAWNNFIDQFIAAGDSISARIPSVSTRMQ